MLLHRFTGDLPVAELCLDIRDIKGSINGRTVPLPDGIRIDLNIVKDL